MHVLKYGDEFNNHAEVLNKCFNKNLEIYVPSRYKLNDNYLVWFPKEAKFNEVTQKYESASLDKNSDDYGWINIIKDNQIKEYNKLRDYRGIEIEHLHIPYRIVFEKPYDYPKYLFIGVYETLYFNKNTHKFQQIKTELDLSQL